MDFAGGRATGKVARPPLLCRRLRAEAGGGKINLCSAQTFPPPAWSNRQITRKEDAGPVEQKHKNTRQLLVDHITAGQADFYRLAYSYVKNRDAALDVVQESIVKALSKVDSLREPSYLKTWFYRILINESMNYFRQSKNLLPYDEAALDRAEEGGDPAERLDLYAAIERLSLNDQTVIRLRFFEDLKLEEIAQITDANLNTVKSRLYKALRKLKDMTGEEIYDDEPVRARAGAV